jgi:acyl-CoA reductase-like NAD-dependent aldehyde dehydrogenase
MLTSVNPATGQVIRNYEEISNEEPGDRVEAANRAFLTWRATTPPRRVEKLRNAYRVCMETVRMAACKHMDR